MKALGIVVAGACVGVAPSGAAAQPLGPTPYLCSSDSPFNAVSFVWFYREAFESGFQVPGVSASAGAVYGPGGLTDSVDCDDGTIDGSGTNGHSFFFASGSVGIRFTFSAAVLGALPTHAGVVWTDGNNPIRFEAFDALGVSLGVIQGNHADGTFAGTTAEDRFYGFIHAAGISAILISNGSGGIEVDHLQYGLAGSACYANCDQSTTPPALNVLDFTCFLNRFAAGDSYANCDQSTTPPVLNVLDFTCFLNAFAAGCP